MADMLGSGNGGGATVNNRVQQGAYNTTDGTKQGTIGQFHTNDIASALLAAMNDPKRAYQLLREAQGQHGRALGFMSPVRESLYGNAYQTALSLVGPGMPGYGEGDTSGLEQTTNDFLKNAVQGNDLLGYGRRLGNKTLNQTDFTGMTSDTMQKILRASLALEGMDMGDLGGAVASGNLDDLIYQAWGRSMGEGSGDQEMNFSDLLGNSRYKKAMNSWSTGLPSR